MTDVLPASTSSASLRSSAGATTATPAGGLTAASPKELLLLAQAVYASGATQAAFEAFPTLFAQRLNPRYVPHPHAPPPSAPPALATPAACMQQYRMLLDSLEPAPGIPNPSLSASTSAIELKRPQARTHLRLARKAYTERLVQVKEQLATEEAPMRALLQEIEEIQSGAWDARLSESYTLVRPSNNPDEARYVFDPSGALAGTESARLAKEMTANAPLASDASGAAATGDSVLNASAIAEGQEASLAAVPSQGLADIPEEESEKAGTTAASGPSAATGRKGSQATGISAASAASTGKPVSASSAGTSTGVSASKAGASKPPAAERRSSGRTSRHSISAMSDIAPPPPLSVITNSDASSGINTANHNNQLAPISAAAGDSVASAADPSPTSAAMELDSSRDSQPSGSAAPAPTSRRGRGGRRASVSTSRDNKRKRTATPLDGQRGPSPALSDRSRSKRIKTEEPDSSSGTPGAEGERADAAVRRFRNSAPHLISQMHGSIHSTFFKDPVREGDALNYFEIVKRPMDLKTLLQKVKAGQVTCTAEFKRDVALIFANAVMYNGTNHDVARDARAMWADVQGLFSVLEQAEQRAT